MRGQDCFPYHILKNFMLKIVTEVSCCYKYVNRMKFSGLCYYEYFIHKKLMYHTRMSVRYRAKEEGQRAHFGTPGVNYTHGVYLLLKARKLW